MTIPCGIHVSSHLKPHGKYPLRQIRTADIFRFSKFLYKRKVNWGIDGHAFCIQELIQKWVQQTEHPIKIAICLEDSDILCSFARAMATQANLQTAGYGLA